MNNGLIKSKYEVKELISEDIISFCYNGKTHYLDVPIIIWEYKKEFLSSNTVTRLINISEKLIGFKHLSLFHINDSKVPFQSNKDFHQGIGHGYIYNKSLGGDTEALKTLFRWAKRKGIPMVLETHGSGYYNAPKDKGQYL